MLDVHGQNASSARENRSFGAGTTSLNEWLQQQIGLSNVRVKSRLRGNNLYLLWEGNPCPAVTVILPKLMTALSAAALVDRLPPEAPPVYRVIVYGRLLHGSTPEWTEVFAPQSDRRASERSPEATPPRWGAATQVDTSETASQSVLQAARHGQSEAIARYLSDAFSTLGIAVRVRLETRSPTQATHSSLPTPHSPLPTPHSPQRLFVICESAYSPDPLLLAEPIAQHLRALELTGFQDAVVFGQVAGETKPEWLLGVDLTPPDDVLRAWARWGDVQAITRLLNRSLRAQQVETAALLKDGTLHLTCQGLQAETPDKLTTIAVIVPLLEALSPQGIRAATLFGLAKPEPNGIAKPATNGVAQSEPNGVAKPDGTDRLRAATVTPLWVHWLDLSADPEPKTTFNLAQEGHLDAIAFLLTRMLNPDLDRKLATGGIQVQVRQKADLLHIMGEAPTCPLQSQMGSAIARFLKPLQIPGITGVRIYGRRSGQKQPLWSYGVDFQTRDRLVPEATPEFAVSDAYVGDLLAPPGALVLRTATSEPSRSPFGNLWETAIERMQRSLLWSQLFVPLDPAHQQTHLTRSYQLESITQRSATVAFVWGTVGLLLVVQADWLLSRWAQLNPPAPITASTPAPAPAASTTQPSLPTLTLKKSKSEETTVFNNSGFTQPGAASSTSLPEAADLSAFSAAALPASPLRPKAGSLWHGAETYPTFNSRQLDEKLALYQAYLKDNGTPDVLIIGSSRALRGVDPIALQIALASQGYGGAKIFNFGVNGATAQVVDAIVCQLLPPDKLPKLILWADGARAFNSGRNDVTYNGIVASDGYKTLTAGSPLPGTVATAVADRAKTAIASAGTVTDTPPTSLSGGYHTVNQELNQRLSALSALYSQRDRLKTLLRDGLVSLLPQSPAVTALNGTIASSNLSDVTSPSAAAANAPTSVLADGQSAIDVDGFLPLPNRFNPATYYQKYARVDGDYDSDYDSFNLEGSQAQALTHLAQFSQARQIALIFVNLPLTADYLDPTRKRHEDTFQEHMLRLSTQLGFVYRDLNQASINQPDYFSDPSHLNRYGAYEVSRRLAIDVMIPWNQARH